MRKDQERALWAYQRAQAVSDSDHLALDDYEIAVQAFGATLLRSGLAVAVSMLERNTKHPAYRSLLSDMAGQLPLPDGNGQVDTEDWPSAIRGLDDVPTYMLKTREALACVTWLRRACRALGD